ncbi:MULTISPECIES: helix-turn-helix transcriptional regulator [unclassified Streptomyces]|uniref:helix-turn-helix transcriptional regulator n=1 Tax=unclassified Streptomyces TaxID=2593676 RepID=UPI000DBA558A|nr:MULTISPECIES: helix-turn-helix transcriptional regulator [unclassified Streptomyces]MYT75530.1 helix-turn-helix domain-containing protein [Streptomyces sp. SID8367]RAJ86936.1 AraC-like DNA-binding protein [Streptomyces sp. PsTaAH-137]
MDTLHFDSSDLEVTEDFLSRNYARMRIGNGTPETGRARIRRDAMPGVTVDELDLDFDMSYAVTPLQKICLCLVHEGTIRDHGFAKVEDAFGPGDVVSFAPPELPYQGRICAARYNITMLDPELLTRVAATDPRAAPGPVRLLDHRPTSDAAASYLRRTVIHVRDHVLGDPATAAEPLIVSTAAQHLAASVLAAFPNTALTEPTGTDRHDAHSATLRRAVAHIDEHAHEALTVAEIAAAAHVTIRALQYAFRRHLDTTPLAHLRRVRLERAHADLRDADPTTGVTVTGIAARWGFYHPGRFATLYRDTYGRPPLHTLTDR